MTTQSWLIAPDLHFPFQDPSYLSVVTEALRMLVRNKRSEFRGFVQLGDFGDFWQLSDYDRDPARQRNVIDDLREYSSQIDIWEKIMPEGTVFHQLEGNHEDRLRRYIWQRAPDIAKLVKSFPEVLRFPERNKFGKVRFIWHPIGNWKSCKIGNTVFHHGHYFNKHVAVANLDRYPSNFVTGHTHRVQLASNGSRFSVSLGHGSDEAYTSHNPVPTNWRQAFGVYTVRDGIGAIEVIEVEDGKCTFRGEAIG